MVLRPFGFAASLWAVCSVLFDEVHPAIRAFARTVLHNFRVHRAIVLRHAFRAPASLMLGRGFAPREHENAYAKP